MEQAIRAEYVDTADALRRLGGNSVIYKTLLRKFQEGDHFTPIETALSARDTVEATKAAHALKGLSANLSLPKVRDLSVTLEEKCKQGELVGLPLAELKDALAVTNDVISEVIAELS